MGGSPVEHDTIGFWSEIRLEIIREYASAYSRILTKNGFWHAYIDAFASSGQHLSRQSKEMVPGSPLNALSVSPPPFDQYHFIDLNSTKVEALRDIAGNRADVDVYEGDCNRVLLDEVFPLIPYSRYRRALCLLDPYGLHLNWRTIQAASATKNIEVFLNCPLLDINLNALKHDRARVAPRQAARMTAFWGDESWRDECYVESPTLFGTQVDKIDNHRLAEAFRRRLRTVGGFAHVPAPIPMRQSTNSTLYYLFFASHRPVAAKIVDDIFTKYGRAPG
jgi:three-Cys-motif partner protein